MWPFRYADNWVLSPTFASDGTALEVLYSGSTPASSHCWMYPTADGSNSWQRLEGLPVFGEYTGCRQSGSSVAATRG